MSNEKSIWNFFKAKGLSDGATAGIMGNLKQESGFRPTALNSIGAYGIAQWLGGRKASEQAYALSHGEAPSSLNAQLNYLYKEMKSGSYGSIQTLNVLPPKQAALYFEKHFEKAGKGAHNPTREAYAAQIFKQMNGKAGPYTAGSGVGGGAPIAYPSGKDPISIINNAMKVDGFSLTNPFHDAGAIALRAVLVIVGLIILIFALWSAVQRMGRS